MNGRSREGRSRKFSHLLSLVEHRRDLLDIRAFPGDAQLIVEHADRYRIKRADNAFDQEDRNLDEAKAAEFGGDKADDRAEDQAGDENHHENAEYPPAIAFS